MNTPPASAITWSMTGTGRTRAPLQCQCGKMFIPLGPQRYCSDDCRPYSKPKYLRTCRECGEKYRTWKRDGSRYCSVKCKGKARKLYHALECVQCGKSFETIDKRKRTCSPECRTALRRASGNYGGMVQKQVLDVIEAAPDDPRGLISFLETAPDTAFDRSWVALLTMEFCDGRRSLLSECLCIVRDRYRSRSGTAAPQAVE